MWPFSRARAACAETRDWLLLGTGDPAAATRAERHLPHCPVCQREQAHLQEVRGDLRAGDPPLDDVTRARMLERLRPALDDLAAGRARGAGGRGSKVAVVVGAVALAAAAAIVVGIGLQRARVPAGSGVETGATASGEIAGGDTHRGESRTGPAGAAVPADRKTPAPQPAPASDQAPLATPSRGLALIRPLEADVPSDQGTRTAVGARTADGGGTRGDRGPVQRMVLSDGAREPALLGEHARLLLVGPADLEVLSASPALLEVRLSRGTLVGQYQRGSGERLRIFSPGARTDIVGTIFSIEAGARSSRVAVAHGRVLVRGDDADDRLVTAGHVWTSSRPMANVLPKFSRSFARLFAEHARVTTDRRQGAHAQSPPPRRSAAASTSAARVAAPLDVEEPSGVAAPAEAPAGGAAAEPAPATAAGSTALPLPSAAAGQSRPPPGAAAVSEGRSPPPGAAAGETQTASPAPGASGRPLTPPTGSSAPIAPLSGSTAGSVPGAGSAAGAPPPASAGSSNTTPGSPAAVYALAERAMSRGDLDEARRRLIQVIELPAAGTLTDAAGYELAQIALRAGNLKEARVRLESLAGSSLAEPAHLLACDVELRAGDRDAARGCYRRFRLQHPGSVQDAEALGALLRLSPGSADCTTGRALLDEYLTRYPEGSVAGEARQRRQRCTP